MTSSLVGSEMCIRDSYCTSKESAIAQAQATNNQARPISSEVQWRFAPVSYTHLTLPTICSV
eukprot:11953827-Prorocentrum_lima.AAC.1